MHLLENRLPKTPYLTPKEFAWAIGFSPQFVGMLIKNNKLTAISCNARAEESSVERMAHRIPRAAALAWMIEHANHQAGPDFVSLVCALIDELSPADKATIQNHMNHDKHRNS